MQLDSHANPAYDSWGSQLVTLLMSSEDNPDVKSNRAVEDS
jgi:hypothetical protein